MLLKNTDSSDFINSDTQSFPLCVDLDGTLINTDTLIETLIGNLRDWSTLIRLPGWILQGKAKLKAT